MIYKKKEKKKIGKKILTRDLLRFCIKKNVTVISEKNDL